MKTVKDFICCVDKRRDGAGNDVYYSVFMIEDCGPFICEGADFYAVKWNDSTREAKFFKSEADLAGNNPSHIVDFKKEIPLLKGLVGHQRYYFVHSYHAKCDSDENIMMTCDYGYEFAAAVVKDNIMGVQFHPEKSHDFGMALLKNYVKEY